MKKAGFKPSNSGIRAAFCALFTILIFAAFAVRLFSWQIIESDEYKEDALSSTSYTMTTEASRGEILDRNGKELVVNDAGYMIIFNKLYMKEGTENEIIHKLINLMDLRHEEWIDKLPVYIDSNGVYQFMEDNEATVEFIKSKSMLNMNPYSTAEDCMAAFVEHYEVDESLYSEEEIRDIVSVRYNMEFCGYSNSNPYKFATDISRDMIAIVLENSQGFPGVECSSTFVRYYKDGDLAPHLLGSVGAISQAEYDELKDKGYSLDDRIGKSGIEAALEEYLRGTDGEKRITKTSDGAVVEETETVHAVPGDTVYLTIDSEIQKATNAALEKQVTAAGKKYGDCVAGAAVMLDVSDFSVLACSSYPSYDLQLYNTDSEYYSDLMEDDTLPLFDRALTGNFIPGSVFKPCVAAAGLEEGIITESSTIFCSQNYDYYKTDIIKCLGYHSSLNVKGALAKSCNYFFADLGRMLGIDAIDIYAEKFGLGVNTGVEVYETTGILAGRDSTVWYDGNTCQAAIGQSDNAFTPMQLATYAATIANDGVRLRTHFVDKITDFAEEEVILNNGEPEVVETVGVSTENMEIVQTGMRQVVTSGTASDVFKDYGIAVAAKTGTAENSGSDHVTFIAYAPYDNPEVAVAVVIEHGGKGQYSMGVAKAMFDAYFKSTGKLDTSSAKTSSSKTESSTSSSENTQSTTSETASVNTSSKVEE